MSTLVCLLEERSAKEMLAQILPRLVPEETDVRYIVFEGKQDMEKNIQRKLQFWLAPDSCFLILRDQDSGDCRAIKHMLQEKVAQSGKTDCSIVRIACHELESFYLGDLAAVEAGLAIPGLSEHQRNRKFRTPDMLANASQELKGLTGNAYQKLNGSRAIAPHLTLDGGNRSASFNTLLSGIRRLAESFL